MERGPDEGSWAHLRHQNVAQAVWLTHVAKDVVAELQRVAQRIGPELVLAAGDPRELAAVKEHLPTALLARWQDLPGSRAVDGGKELLEQRVEDAVARHTAYRTLDLLERYAEERGQLMRACEGVEDVVAALRKAQVETLLLTTDLGQDGSLWFGPDPLQLATTAEELRALGAREPVQGPLVDVLLRAAVGGDADVQVVPHEMEQAPRGGVGAVLRYADSDTATARQPG